MKSPLYSSILDSFLDIDERTPDWKEIGLKEAVTSGKDLLDRTHSQVDDLLDDLTSGSGTSAPKQAGRTPLEARMAEKEAATPRLGGNRSAQTRFANTEDYKNPTNDSLVDEITTSLDAADKGDPVKSRAKTDGELKSWIKTLLAKGVTPAKVAAAIDKRADLDLGAKSLGKSLLNGESGAPEGGMAGVYGLAYVDGDNLGTCASTHKHIGSTTMAKSVKQLTACKDCSHFKNNSNVKTCSLYQLPIVGNAKELGAVINKLTAGVPKASKRAALIQIANRDGQRVENTVYSRMAGDTKGQAKRAAKREDTLESNRIHFDGVLIQRLHVAGHSLKKIAKAANDKFGTLETSKGIREFVASLQKTKEGIVLAKADADFLKSIGIHNASIVGAEKCLSCAAHIAHKEHVAATKSDMVTRSQDTFTERTMASVRQERTTTKIVVTANSIAKLHSQGHSLEKIYQKAVAKVGSVQASKAVKEFVAGLKTSNTKVALSQIDCTFLKNKLGAQNAINGAAKCGSCTYRKGMHCGFTGGTLLNFPGMDKQATNIKTAANAPKDGYAMLGEFDLISTARTQDIDMTPPSRAEVITDSVATLGDIE